MKLTIEFMDDNKTAIVSTVNDNGIKTDKVVSLYTLSQSILASVGESYDMQIITPILEERKGVRLIQCKIYNTLSKIYILHLPKSFQPMPVYNRFYPNTGIPSLLFAVKVVNNRLDSLFVVSVKDEEINNNTKIYNYPYSNVDYKGLVCLGSNRFTVGIENDNYRLLYEVPYQFISMPNTSAELPGTNKNTKRLNCEELIREYQGEEFDDELLVSSIYKNYYDFINKIGGKLI